MNFLANVTMLNLLSLLMLRVKAKNSSVPSLKRAIDSLIQKVRKRVVFGNASDPIAITELPGYTGWNRNRFNSKVDQCFIEKIGNRTVAVDASLNILRYDISINTNNIWSVSVACPNVTVTAEQGHLPIPLFYGRAYGPAILAGYQNASTSMVHNGVQYSLTEISFSFLDPGLYTVEVALESMHSPNIYSLPHTSDLAYDGFLLRGFPLILNVTTSIDISCNTAESCKMTLCTSKDIEADFSILSGRWIVLGHTSRIMNKPTVDEFSFNDQMFRSYAQGSNRLSIEADYQPIHCMLAPLRPSLVLLEACTQDTGIHFILIGDSVTQQHEQALQILLNPRNRLTFVDLKGK